MFNETWNKRFQELAYTVSLWSKDPSTKVGAVIVNEERIVIGLGYNGFARGVRDDERLYNREEKYPRVIHAEINAILNATGSVKGCTLFTWPFPCCAPCSAFIIQAGVRHVVYPHEVPERWKETVNMGQDMLKEAGVSIDFR